MKRWVRLRWQVRMLGVIDFLLGTHLVNEATRRWLQELEAMQTEIISLHAKRLYPWIPYQGQPPRVQTGLSIAAFRCLDTKSRCETGKGESCRKGSAVPYSSEDRA